MRLKDYGYNIVHHDKKINDMINVGFEKPLTLNYFFQFCSPKVTFQILQLAYNTKSLISHLILYRESAIALRSPKLCCSHYEHEIKNVNDIRGDVMCFYDCLVKNNSADTP